MRVLLVAVAVAALTAQTPSSTHGPTHGTLVLQGGIGLVPAIAKTFVGLAGGPSAHIIVIPTASVGDEGPPGFEITLANRMKESWGVRAVTIRHSLSRDTSNSDQFVEPFRSATGVWILGGFPANLIRWYLGTKTERAIHELLDRGGVVGGESAGAMIQASWLDTTDDEDFTSNDRALIKDNGPAGFNLLTRAGVFPHFDKRGPEAALKFSREHPDQLAVGIDNDTALVVKGDRAGVIGLGTVSVYDGKRGEGARPVVLRSGERYDFTTVQTVNKIDYDTFCKLPDEDTKRKTFLGVTAENRADLMRTLLERWRDANKAKLSETQLTLLADFMATITPDTYADGPKGEEQRVKSRAVAERMRQLFSMDQIQAMQPNAPCIAKGK